MQCVFGFPLQTSVYRCELPLGVEADYSLGAAAGLSPADAMTIQIFPKHKVDISAFGWRKSFEAEVGGAQVEVYELPGVTDAVIPVWTLPGHRAWMQLRHNERAKKSQMLAEFLSGLRIDVDPFGIPRVRLTRGLVPGNPYLHLENRDDVHFWVTNGQRRGLVLRLDGALASDARVIEGNHFRLDLSTPFGITVQVSGPAAGRRELSTMAKTVAGSIELVRR
jgi:hypothetical protein